MDTTINQPAADRPGFDSPVLREMLEHLLEPPPLEQLRWWARDWRKFDASDYDDLEEAMIERFSRAIHAGMHARTIPEDPANGHIHFQIRKHFFNALPPETQEALKLQFIRVCEEIGRLADERVAQSLQPTDPNPVADELVVALDERDRYRKALDEIAAISPAAGSSDLHRVVEIARWARLSEADPDDKREG